MVLNSDDIAKLTGVLDAHCERYGIRSKDGRMHAAASLLRFYQRGFEDPEVLAQLIADEDKPNL